MNSVYSNAVTASDKGKLEQWLEEQGFSQAGSKSTVSVALHDLESVANQKMSFTKSNG